MSTSLECAMAWVGSVGDRLVTACEGEAGPRVAAAGRFARDAGRGRAVSRRGEIWLTRWSRRARSAVAGKRIAVGDESGRLYVLDTEFERRASFDSPPRDAKPRHVRPDG